MGNQHDSSDKWYNEDVFPWGYSAFFFSGSGYEREIVDIRLAEERAISAKLIRRCNNGRKSESPDNAD